MRDMLEIDIPESIVTRFLVATDEPTMPGVHYLRDVLGAGGLGRVARDLLASPLLMVGGGAAAGSPWEGRLDRLGGGEGELAEVRSARQHLVVSLIAAPAAQPRHAQAARLVARVLGAATGGAVVDLAANQVVTEADPPGREAERFVLGHDWLGMFMTADGEQEVRCDTAGLHRFGLPELLVRGIAYEHLLTAVSVLRGLAQRLLAEHLAWLRDGSGAARREIAADQVVTPGDVMRFWSGAVETAESSGKGRELPVRLTPDPALCPECMAGLRVTGPGGDNDETWWEVAAGPLIPVF